MKRIITYIISLFAFIAAYGQGHTDSATVYFERSGSRFDPDMGQNREAMDGFINTVRDNIDDVESIIVRGYASPEGNSAFNRRLSRERCESVASYLVAYAGAPASLIEKIPEGEAWDVLLSLVENNPDVPARQDVLRILRETPVWVFNSNNKIVDGRKRQLMRLNGGHPYKWMLDNLFPRLRMAVMVSVRFKDRDDEIIKDTVRPTDETVSEPSRPWLGEPEDSIISDGDLHQPYLGDDVTDPAVLNGSVEGESPSRAPWHRVALKTNILYYAILMPNLELEGMINSRWSVALEGNIAWYSNSTKDRTYQVAMVLPEVRYWIRPRAPWHGMFAGVFAGAGMYDLENGGTGYRGEGGFAGLSFGYMWPISRNFSLEASIGAGYMYTRYKEYEPDDGHFVYMRTKELNYFGPLKLKFSVVWRFADCNKSK